MAPSNRLAFVALTLAAVTGCHKQFCVGGFADDDRESTNFAKGGSDSAAGSAPPSAVSGAPDGTRAVVEADIVELDDEQDRIYAMSKSGSLAIVDAATPRQLGLVGKISIPGVPFEMYRRGNVLLAMANNAVRGDGCLVDLLPEDATPPAADATSGAAVTAVDVTNPSSMTTLGTVKVPGEIADSRIVGNILYLATYENASCYGCGAAPRTLVTSFDISTPTDPKQVDQVVFESAANSGGFNAAWSTPWKRSIIATATRLYVGGLASDAQTTTNEGVIEVLDISDPAGKLEHGATITMAGPVMSRWQMDESDGVLRVVSQRGAGRTQNGDAYPDIDTFRIESSKSLVRIGHMTMQLPRQEGLKTVRFDGPRGYAITFNQTDPLFTIDLSEPAKPVQKGELQMPGWMFHLEPRGDKLIGLGLDRTDTSGNLNVSLFDVADLTKPTLLQRVSFGPNHIYEDYMITQGVMAEDQDRIQKAFRIDQDGLIAVPFSGADACAEGSSGIQILSWSKDTLTKQALLPMPGNPRRAIRRDSATSKELLGVSDSNVRAFSLQRLDTAEQVADVVIGKCVARPVEPTSFGGWNEGDDYDRGRGRGYGTGSSSDERCE